MNSYDERRNSKFNFTLFQHLLIFFTVYINFIVIFYKI